MNKSRLLFHVLGAVSIASAYTWPGQWDELEDIMYLQSGYNRRGFHDGVTPCSAFPQGGPGPHARHAAAEWVRTAFHDAITHNKETGTGGLDGSLLYETDRPENTGSIGFTDTFGFFHSFLNRRVSLADLIALGMFTAVKECGGPTVQFRAGRIDATEAGESGVPEPTTDIDATIAQFEKAGYTKEEMIAMVACGHTLGGVHGNDFPDIVGNSSAEAFPQFDSTTAKFDNVVVTEFLSGNTTNPLAAGPDATNSDQRVFVVDKNATMQSLADPDTFRSTCATVFERIIDTVPSAVTLSEPITPIEVKPRIQQFYLQDQSTLQLEGNIRVRTTERQAPDEAKMEYFDSNGNHCDTCTITAPIARFQGGMGIGFGEQFQFYEFNTNVAVGAISKFNVHFTANSDETHTNNGLGFPLETAILNQSPNSCLEQKDDGNGNWNLTAVAAVRNDRTNLPTWFEVTVKRFTEGIALPKLDIQKIEMARWKDAGSDSEYTLYSGSFPLPIDSWSTAYDLYNGEGDDVASVVNINSGQGACNDWTA
ncbi:hypothetical protein AAF712_001867 [Marasmius tenuissimus]|uniref:Peroxidase n=1 Tax=Marasmius tenuissimus TaxID=585030 RepID=A0ABR3ABG0_9AGAR